MNITEDSSELGREVVADERRTDGALGEFVNDMHSQLNLTRVHRVERPESLEQLRRVIEVARADRLPICLAGARHSMGAQQFATNACLIDARGLNRVLEFDPQAGTVEAEAGIQWPELIQALIKMQGDRAGIWTIRQKQTGADRLTLAGALSSNIHGRGLRMKPFVDDIESFTILDADGQLRRCSRTENADWFRLAVGGYGLFGAIYSIQLRLVRRRKMRRVVRMITVEQLVDAFDQQTAAGFEFGDLQFAIDPHSPDFLRRGVFSCYEPVTDAVQIAPDQKRLSREDWRRLVYLAHADPSRGFAEYASYYARTDGQIYWSDLHQLTEYVEDYHRELDERLHSKCPGSEIISEVYVPKEQLVGFTRRAAEDFRKHGAQIIYGTIRRIEADRETFLPWARRDYSCLVLNVHTEHSPLGVAHSASAFRRLIDLAIEHDGSFYLTYHKFARRDQVEACYPRFQEFLQEKERRDPEGCFQSDWFRHYRKLFQE